MALLSETYASLKDLQACRLYKDHAGTIVISIAEHPRVMQGNAEGRAHGVERQARMHNIRARALCKVRKLPVDGPLPAVTQQQIAAFNRLLRAAVQGALVSWDNLSNQKYSGALLRAPHGSPLEKKSRHQPSSATLTEQFVG